LPSVAIDAIAVETGGHTPPTPTATTTVTTPSTRRGGPVSRDRERFREWMEKHVLGTENFFGEYLKSVKEEGRIGI
jgi:glutaconate CoA-transferase subunit A